MNWHKDPAAEQRYIAEDDGQACGFLRVRRFAQFFGGKTIPMGGLASVSVDQHARGKGVASSLLAAALRGMHEEGVPISVLFTGVPALYRNYGWERTGVVEWAELPTVMLSQVERPQAKFIFQGTGHKASQEIFDDVHACYRSVVASIDGMLDRSTPALGHTGLLERDLSLLAYDEEGKLRGYLNAEHHLTREGVIDVHDFIAQDREVTLAMLRRLGSWAGSRCTVRLRLADPGVLGLLAPNALGLGTSTDVWYLRVVDLAKAVQMRGWPGANFLAENTAVEIEVIDEHAPWNAGNYRLFVEGGTVHCEPGAKTAAVRLHARALGPWFTGTASTETLRRAGFLEGDRDAAAVLDALVGSPGPVRMLDQF